MNPSPQPNGGQSFNRATGFETPKQEEFRVLLVSANLESRRAVSKILEELSVYVVPCATLAQAEQSLLRQGHNLIFCDEHLPDGEYSSLLEMKDPERIPPPLVVLTRNGEWELYMDATRRGAFDVIRSPWCPTDIELSVIRVAREEKYSNAKVSG